MLPQPSLLVICPAVGACTHPPHPTLAPTASLCSSSQQEREGNLPLFPLQGGRHGESRALLSSALRSVRKAVMAEKGGVEGEHGSSAPVPAQNPTGHALRLLQQQRGGAGWCSQPSHGRGVQTKTELHGQQWDAKSDLHF